MKKTKHWLSRISPNSKIRCGKRCHLTPVKHISPISTNTSNFVSKLNDERLGDRKVSKAALILKSIQAVKSEWSYNIPFDDVWVLGDAVYLRCTKAFDAILKKGQNLQYPLPNDTRIIISIMESSGMLESYDDDNNIFNFAPGIFTHENIEKIFLGEMTPNVEQLLKLKWKGTVFGKDPMPDNGDGILLSHDGKLIEKFSAHGKVTRYEREKVMSDLQSARLGQGEVSVTYVDEQRLPIKTTCCMYCGDLARAF